MKLKLPVNFSIFLIFPVQCLLILSYPKFFLLNLRCSVMLLSPPLPSFSLFIPYGALHCVSCLPRRYSTAMIITLVNNFNSSLMARAASYSSYSPST